MQHNELMDEFLEMSIKYLTEHSENFLKKLENGDISAIKTLFDYINKTGTRKPDKQKKNQKITLNYGDMSYEEAFEHIKEAITKDYDE